MNILITGVAGFIGFSLAHELLRNKKYKIIGIDNLDKYYSVRLKKQRIKILRQNKNFFFSKVNILNEEDLLKHLKKKKIDNIFHFAAQAGVRYVDINPKKYIDVNISGFFNILKISLILKPKNFFYASSSSVYGDLSEFPVLEDSKLKPKNIYGLSKKINEDIVNLYCNKVKTKFIGLRFFTVYGEWGRPDMLLIKFMISSIKKSIFKVHNFGNHVRDFTYIGDVVKILMILLSTKILDKHTVLNICSSKPLKLKNIIFKLIKLTKFNLVKKISINKLEVLKTYGSNNKLLKIIKNYKFTNFDNGLKNTYLWFLKNKKYIN
jgi:UDP-glucuronate 4-epimerase